MTTLSQGERVLRVLADGQWHTTAEIHRRAGTMRLNSRIAELRKKGREIECEHLPRKTGPRAYRYRWMNAPTLPPAVNGDAPLEPEVPRTPEHRFRIYVVPRYEEQELIATAPTPAMVGIRLCELGEKGKLHGCCVGILDTHGTDEKPGTWLLNPHEARW